MDGKPGEPEYSVLATLYDVFEQVIRSSAPAKERTEGVAFLRAAKDLYDLSSITYLCINIPLRDRTAFAHCLYSDTTVRHVVGGQYSGPEALFHLMKYVSCEENFLN